jgi:hypothetical protein
LTRAQRIVMAFGGLASVVLAVLMLFDFMSFELYFILCLLGFMAVVHLSGPFISRPRWRSRANLVILAGVFLFGLIVLNKVIDILGIRPF